MLDAKGAPMMVQRTLIRPPSSQLGPIDAAARAALMAASPMAGKYDTAIDRESAFEILSKRANFLGRGNRTARRYGPFLCDCLKIRR